MLAHDVLRIVAERPEGFYFTPGQATEIAINREGLQDQKRPFNITSIPGNQNIEFIIKIYPQHDGFTEKLRSLVAGDQLILHRVFGSIVYRGEGVFIAGGTGITPFVSILRDLKKKQAIGDNKMIFINKRCHDIILKDELEGLLGENLLHVLTREKADGYAHGHVTRDFLKAYVADNDGMYYLCGPPPMMDAVERHLFDLGVGESRIVKEGW